MGPLLCGMNWGTTKLLMSAGMQAPDLPVCSSQRSLFTKTICNGADEQEKSSAVQKGLGLMLLEGQLPVREMPAERQNLAHS